MAIYSVGRKRVILALLLTTVLLLTLDLRGNPAIDAAREGFTQVMRPVETATSAELRAGISGRSLSTARVITPSVPSLPMNNCLMS